MHVLLFLLALCLGNWFFAKPAFRTFKTTEPLLEQKQSAVQYATNLKRTMHNTSIDKITLLNHDAITTQDEDMEEFISNILHIYLITIKLNQPLTTVIHNLLQNTEHIVCNIYIQDNQLHFMLFDLQEAKQIHRKAEELGYQSTLETI